MADLWHNQVSFTHTHPHIHTRTHRRVLSWGHREGAPMDDLGSDLKVFCHSPLLPEHLPRFVHTGACNASASQLRSLTDPFILI